jgi:hypothetical protein
VRTDDTPTSQESELRYDCHVICQFTNGVFSTGYKPQNQYTCKTIAYKENSKDYFKKERSKMGHSLQSKYFNF